MPRLISAFSWAVFLAALFSGSRLSAAEIARSGDGFSIRSKSYRAHLTPQGWLDRLEVGKAVIINGIALGEMGRKGAVTSELRATKIVFQENGFYQLSYDFNDDGFVVSAQISGPCGTRDGVDGKYYFVWFKLLLGADAQMVKVFEPPLEFVLPAKKTQNCDKFQVTFASGVRLDVTKSGDATFPDDPGVFGSPNGPPFSWIRGSMKPEKEYQYRFDITQAKKGEQNLLAAPAMTLECKPAERRATNKETLSFVARARPEDVLRLGPKAKGVKVHWTVSDLWGNPILNQTQSLKRSPNGEQISLLNAPVGRLGWYRVDAVVADTAKKLIPNRLVSDYTVVAPGVLPEITGSGKDLNAEVNADLSAWVGFGLERIDCRAAEILPAVAKSAQRTGLKYFCQCNPPEGCKSAAEFGEYVGQLVARYHSHCKHWEMINEPQATIIMIPEQYFEYLKAGHAAAKQADPDCKILGPTICGIDLPYLEAVYKLGAADYMDIISVHPYTGHWRGWLEQGVEQEYRSLLAMMAKYGDEKKEVWFTENGFQHVFQATSFPEVQARFLTQQFLLCDSWGLPRQRVYYFFLKDHGFENWYVVRQDNSLSPAAAGMRNLAQQTAGLEYKEQLTLGRNRIGLRYVGSTRQVVALFSYDCPAHATLSTSGTKVLHIDFFGNRQTLKVEDGKVTVPVTGYPSYAMFPASDKVAGVEDDWGENLALAGICTASSGTALAAQANDRICTANGDHNGVPGWASELDAPLPHWLEVRLPKPAEIRRVVVYTNSAFCGLSGIRDYEIQVQLGDEWKTVGKGKDNVDLWVLEHKIPPVTSDRVRILVTRLNNGGLRDDPRKYADLVARVAELEVYTR